MQASKIADKLIPLYILDPCQVTPKLMSPNRLGFLLESLEDLDNSLNENYLQRLFITFGSPLQIFKNMVHHIRGFMGFKGKIVIGLEKDYQPYEKVRDTTITQWAKCENVRLQFATTQTLWNLDRLGKLNNYKSCESMTEFKEFISKLDEPSKDLDTPVFLPPPPNELFIGKVLGNSITNYFGKVQFFDHTPSFGQLGMGFQKNEYSSVFEGGEKVSLKRLSVYLRNVQNLKRFNKNCENPTKTNPSSSTQSPYLALGCLSVRKFYYSLKATQRFFKESESESEEVQKVVEKKNESLDSLINSLYWREYHYMIGCYTQNFDQMYDNPISKLTDCWDYNPTYIKAWTEGKTGYPIIDAVMNQLKREGWTHKFNRHVIACFLTRGSLWQTWEVGLNHFQKQLIDFDWSINTANWIWLSNVQFSKKYFDVRLTSFTIPSISSKNMIRRETSSGSTFQFFGTSQMN
jgi:cryptochrome